MSNDYAQCELLFKIHRIKKEEYDDWSLAIEDGVEHDFDAVHAAGLAYLVIERYLSCIKDSDQHKFYEEVKVWLDRMMEDNAASSYIDRIDKPENF